MLKESFIIFELHSICIFCWSSLRIRQKISYRPNTSCECVSEHLMLCGTYSRSQNNVNVVYCNYKETNSTYNVIAKRNSPQTLFIVGNII